jgi:hypothetical protein
MFSIGPVSLRNLRRCQPVPLTQMRSRGDRQGDEALVTWSANVVTRRWSIVVEG